MTDMIRGRYEVLGVVGRGGQGEVLHAIDRQHERQVAIKVYRLTSDDDLTTILQEARILFTLKPHPGLPLVREDFFIGHDRYCIVMDWIEGKDLRTVLAEQGHSGLPLKTVTKYLDDVGAALDHLHKHTPPILHQDVKPSNLILTPEGKVVLVDFGIASWRLPGALVGPGSMGYTAPEVLSGDQPTPATDVYGLAATAATLLAGSPPELVSIIRKPEVANRPNRG